MDYYLSSKKQLKSELLLDKSSSLSCFIYNLIIKDGKTGLHNLEGPLNDLFLGHQVFK